MPIRAAVMTAPNKPVELQSIPDPVIEPGGVLLETIASEVCGTDVHLHRGHLAGVPYPIIPGHVSVGRVLEARGVKEDALGAPLKVGDVVTFYDVHGICGQCYQCTVARQPNRCPHRKVYGITFSAKDGPLGGWAERIYLKPGVRVLRLPEPLGADEVIAGGCGLITGYAAVERSDLAMNDVVLVQGTGPVGLGAVIFAALRGAKAVVAFGAPAARLDLAKAFGASVVMSVTDTTPEARDAAIRELTQGRGADVVIEASGNPKAVPEGLSLMRDGGTYVIAGHYTDAGPIEINPHTHINKKHATVLGQWGTDFHHVHRALAMLAKHVSRIPIAKLIGGRYPIADANRALEDVAALQVTKAVMTPR
ncbi:MAG TPA: zinc-binding dehydrogenase [Gemmatimonadales bacterium]|jgi:L-iditol 2-dehydrogenase